MKGFTLILLVAFLTVPAAGDTRYVSRANLSAEESYRAAMLRYVGSGLSNPFTILHHPLFESEAAKLPGFLKKMPYQLYRQLYIFDVQY